MVNKTSVADSIIQGLIVLFILALIFSGNVVIGIIVIGIFCYYNRQLFKHHFPRKKRFDPKEWAYIKGYLLEMNDYLEQQNDALLNEDKNRPDWFIIPITIRSIRLATLAIIFAMIAIILAFGALIFNAGLLLLTNTSSLPPKIVENAFSNEILGYFVLMVIVLALVFLLKNEDVF